MRIFILTFFISLVLFTGPVLAESETSETLDYYFLSDGGIFLHNVGEPVQSFEYFSIPIIEPYTNVVQIGDVSGNGTIAAVLRGDREHEMRADLVRIDPGKKITPLFGLIKRENLADGRTASRSFVNVDIDHDKNVVTFAVNERFSEKGSTEAEYKSKIYRIPLKGGMLEKIGEFDEVAKDITSGGGSIVVSFERISDKEGYSRSSRPKPDIMRILSPGETEWFNAQFLNMQILSIDMHRDGSKMLIMGNSFTGRNPYKLVEVIKHSDFQHEVSMLEEYAEGESASVYSYGLQEGTMVFAKNVETAMGEAWINYITDTEGVTHSLTRADKGFGNDPVKSTKVNVSEIQQFDAQLAGTPTPTGIPGNLIPCATDGNSSSMFAELNNPDNSVSLLDDKLSKIVSFEIDPDENYLHGIYYGNDTLYQIAQIDLGERLLSFESVPYGRMIAQPVDGEPEQFDIHLAWNIGGKKLGVQVPENSICIGGDEKNLHVVFEYPYEAMFPASETVTPFYLLDRETWMIEHPAYLGKSRDTEAYFVKSFSDDSGNLFVLDSLNSRILKYTESGKRRELGWLPESIPALAHPCDMILFNDSIYVMDPLNTRITVFNLDGKAKAIININEFDKNLVSSRFGKMSENEFTLVNFSQDLIYTFTNQPLDGY